MESDDDGFAKRGGEALDLGDNDFDDSEEENQMHQSDDEDNEPVHHIPPNKVLQMQNSQ